VLITLWRQCYLSYKALFTWRDWPAYTANVLVRPALMATVFGLTGRFARGEQAAFDYVVGMSAFSMMNIVLAGILQSFSGERQYGTLGLLVASPAGRLQAFLTRSVLHYPNGLLNIAVGLAWSALALNIGFGAADWPTVFVGFLVLALSATMFSLFMGNLAIVFRNWNYFMALTTAFWMVFTGVVIPRDSLPAGLYQISEVMPMTHALEGIREGFSGASLVAFSEELALELLVGSIYAVIGFVLFRLLEGYIRSSGAYELSEV
jgi:ABC-type polysaccharide/polyol phosphate export permease